MCIQCGGACELMSQYKKKLVLFKITNLGCVKLVIASKLINSRANTSILVAAIPSATSQCYEIQGCEKAPVANSVVPNCFPHIIGKFCLGLPLE